MKKLFTLMVMCVMAMAVSAQDTWTVAGSANLCGKSWDPALTDNDMTSTDGGTTWTLVKENVTLEAKVKVEFKVVKNHKWGEEYPSSNYNFTVDETGTYKITITFNSSTKDVNHLAEKTGDAVIGEKTWTIAGGKTDGGCPDYLPSSWAPTDEKCDMTKQADGTYMLVVKNLSLLAGIEYEYKVCANHAWDEAYPDAGNANFKVDADGVYDVTFTWDPATKALLASPVAAGAQGISSVKANATTAIPFNLAGQRVANGYKGLIIKNGKKVMAK